MRTGTFFVLICLLIPIAGCARAPEAVVPAAERAAREVHPPEVRPKVPVPRVDPAPAERATVSKRVAELVRTIPYPDGQQRRAVIEAGCDLYTLYKLSRITDQAELKRQALLEAGGNATIAARAIDFLKELRSSSTPEQIRDLVIAGVCGV